MDLLQRIQRAIREEKYRISSHANEEMAEDFMMASDIEHIIFTGKITQRFTKDSRGRRYAVLGIPVTTVELMLYAGFCYQVCY